MGRAQFNECFMFVKLTANIFGKSYCCRGFDSRPPGASEVAQWQSTQIMKMSHARDSDSNYYSRRLRCRWFDSNPHS